MKIALRNVLDELEQSKSRLNQNGLIWIMLIFQIELRLEHDTVDISYGHEVFEIWFRSLDFDLVKY